MKKMWIGIMALSFVLGVGITALAYILLTIFRGIEEKGGD